MQTYAYMFVILCRDFFYWFLSFFSGKHSGSQWLNILWVAQSIAEKIKNNFILQVWQIITTSREEMALLVEQLEVHHEDSMDNEFYTVRSKLDFVIVQGWCHISDFKVDMRCLKNNNK